MVVTEFDLKLANYVQDKGSIDFATCVGLYNKSKSTLKRSIYTLNEYLPSHLHFSISQNEMKTNMSYEDFSNLCKRLELEDYASSVDERVSLIVCQAFLQGIVNMTKLYDTLNLSLSTKKNDRKELGYLLEEKNITIRNRHKRGIQLEGNEIFLRMFVARRLISVMELDKNDYYIPRKANTPVQKLLYIMFEEHLSCYHSKVVEMIEKIVGEQSRAVDYASKKFIYIHLAISLMRNEKGFPITRSLEDMPEVPQHHLLPVKQDSQYMDYLIASLNYKEPLTFPANNNIRAMTQHLIKEIEKDSSIHFYTYEDMYDELYAYLYKCLIKNKLEYYFYDDKLDDTKYVFPKLFSLLTESADAFKNKYAFELTEHQISVLCLIAERFIIKNQMVEKDKPRIVIITNSSVEKVNFFLEVLSQHVNFEMVAHLTINELYKLGQMTFDKIIVFSNRITVLLSELGRESIKLNFYLSTEDVKTLLDKGFTSSRNRKVLVEDLADDIIGKESKEELVHYLKTVFSDYVI